ncbi:matrixin family metalloprotease [Archangium violaceum]|uniref:M57 family metalloprotease n=1 Tax=Archangium violaceum TaxID=83451 RepID=UPI00193C0B23|nr:M57 family metalloprotease [Archangium violaceum]QRK12045.1 matrixin family metalloprotease [Archangium violaceum]
MRKISMALLAGVALVGCGGPEAAEQQQIPTFEEFQAQAIKDEGDVYVVNGDEAIEGIEGLKAYYDNYVANGDVGTTEGGLAVYYSGGRDIKWSATAARNITYCVSKTSFGTRYNTVVSAMANAAAAWEAAANVNFVHSSSYDSNCTASQSGVVFDVRQTSTTSYLARAFFPNSSRSARNVLISTSAFGNVSPWTLTGILRHELGHTLGLRHEHTRSTSSGCYEDANWRALTTYDRSSVMHYPQCNGTQTGDLVLTSYDKSGVKALYP